MALLDGAQPWSRVRCWLRDLAEEAHAGLRDATLPRSPAWIESGSQLMAELFSLNSGTGSPPVETIPLGNAADVQQFLTSVADAALSPVRPYTRSNFLRRSALDALRIRRSLPGISARRSRTCFVSPRRRATSVALWPVVALVLALVLAAIIEHRTPLVRSDLDRELSGTSISPTR
jgi:hypothetical protein